MVCSVLLCLFWLVLVWSLLCQILKMVTLACFWGSFAWNTFAFLLPWGDCLSLMLCCVSWVQQKGGPCFYFYFVSLCLSMSEIRPLLRVAHEQCCWLLIFSCGGMGFPSLLICYYEFIYSLCFLGSGWPLEADIFLPAASVVLDFMDK